KPSGEFVIDNYNRCRPFADFFPGIAGKYGIPMWAFFVNRGQAIFGIGTRDKDHSIMEFFPANKAWQLAALLGFRTFIKLTDGRKIIFYEPFNPGLANQQFDTDNQMRIACGDLQLAETNRSLDLTTTVEYFTIPNDSFAALARIVTVKNSKPAARKLQILDGLPQIVPFGTSNLFLKKLGRTIEAWMGVENLENDAPIFKLEVDPVDRPEVLYIKEGNFYLGFCADKGKNKVIRPIVDPQTIFGPISDFGFPREFLKTKNFPRPKQERICNQMPCAFLPLDVEIKPQEEFTFYALAGYIRGKKALNSSLSRIAQPAYLKQKRTENEKLLSELTADIATQSSSREFDLYCRQTYLDNIMRGGYPVIFKSNSAKSLFYVYSRKHGDLERDYNKFSLSPTYLSQGNGNYRDTNQNRRCDVWFNPQIGDENIIAFFNLLQADGFNPLVIKGTTFNLDSAVDSRALLNSLLEEKDLSLILLLLQKPFTPGEIILFIEENGIKLKTGYDEFLDKLLSHCHKNQEAEHGEGFWSDHWTYNLDLLENYLAVFPEKFREIIFEKKVFTFYDNTEVVKPRREKYLIYGNSSKQLHAVHADAEKKELIRQRRENPHLVRTQYGHGPIYQTTLINKLLCVFANKLASLDPFGVGIEMEADKPNWFDSLNGLPALLGSSTCETFELKRLGQFINTALEKERIVLLSITEEVADLLFALEKILEENDFSFWDKSHSLKEDYRRRTKLGFSGKEIEISSAQLMALLQQAIEKLDAGLKKAKEPKAEIYCSYFINEVSEYENLDGHFVKPLKFIQKKLPLFLEAQMHALRLCNQLKKAKALYTATKKSLLFDKKLKMYKVCAPLKAMPLEIGRCRVFTPGWLENESVWLHMEYKYLLELLKKGLYAEFFADFKNALIPFQNPATYGRSILENSSFLVSSAYPNNDLHGNGYVARLSGSTVELINMWIVMNVGRRPFSLNEKGRLCLNLKPSLPGWLFTAEEKTYSFNFLKEVRVIYHNPKRKDTFGKNGTGVKRITFKDKDGQPQEILSDTIPPPFAEQVRSCQIRSIEAFLG
ncbi:MAG: cellobiose phosphorylase, partial [Candidatus Omnitrophota bacterium]